MGKMGQPALRRRMKIFWLKSKKSLPSSFFFLSLLHSFFVTLFVFLFSLITTHLLQSHLLQKLPRFQLNSTSVLFELDTVLHYGRVSGQARSMIDRAWLTQSFSFSLGWQQRRTWPKTIPMAFCPHLTRMPCPWTTILMIWVPLHSLLLMVGHWKIWLGMSMI